MWRECLEEEVRTVEKSVSQRRTSLKREAFAEKKLFSPTENCQKEEVIGPWKKEKRCLKVLAGVLSD